MYQALYRKWRPRTFDDVVGQEHITDTLKRQVTTGRLSHAYLFIGTRGTGKTTCARILARAVNCENPRDGSPCNECAVCRGIETGGILDVVELDAASNNRVDDVRALQDEAIYSPAAAKKRVYIIDEVHMLSTAAFNALLKILEEPPEHLMFILCTTELHKVLPTIVSRCQRHSFKRIEPDAIAGRLLYVAGEEGINLTPDAAALLARFADGGLRDALSLLDQCSGSEHVDVNAVHGALGLAGSRRIAELLEAVCDRAPERALTLFDRMWKDGKDPAGILDELGDLMRDVLLMLVAPGSCAALLSGVHEEAVLRRFAARLSGSDIMDGMAAIRAADLSGENPRRAAEMCLVSLCVPDTGDSLSALKSRVSRLEAAVRDGLPAAPASKPKRTAERKPDAAPKPRPEPEPKPERKPGAASKSEPEPEPEPKPETIPASRPEPASVPEPERVPAPASAPESPDDVPWYTDDDAPPPDDDYMPPPPPEHTFEPEPDPEYDIDPEYEPEPEPKTEPEHEPVPEPDIEPEPAPAPAPKPAQTEGGEDVWPTLVKRLHGQMDLGTYSMITTATQSNGVYADGVMTVYLATPIAKLMLDTPEMQGLFRRELCAITGEDARVVFTDEEMPVKAETPTPDMEKLEALRRFDNVIFE